MLAFCFLIEVNINEESVEYLCDWVKGLLWLVLATFAAGIAKRCALLQATESIGEMLWGWTMNENVASVSVYCLSYKASLIAHLFWSFICLLIMADGGKDFTGTWTARRLSIHSQSRNQSSNGTIKTLIDSRWGRYVWQAVNWLILWSYASSVDVVMCNMSNYLTITSMAISSRL